VSFTSIWFYIKLIQTRAFQVKLFGSYLVFQFSVHNIDFWETWKLIVIILLMLFCLWRKKDASKQLLWNFPLYITSCTIRFVFRQFLVVKNSKHLVQSVVDWHILQRIRCVFCRMLKMSWCTKCMHLHGVD